MDPGIAPRTPSVTSSAVIFTPSGKRAVGGLRAQSRLGQSRAKCPAWPQLKQAPTGRRTAGCAAGWFGGTALLAGGGYHSLR